MTIRVVHPTLLQPTPFSLGRDGRLAKVRLAMSARSSCRILTKSDDDRRGTTNRKQANGGS